MPIDTVTEITVVPSKPDVNFRATINTWFTQFATFLAQFNTSIGQMNTLETAVDNDATASGLNAQSAQTDAASALASKNAAALSATTATNAKDLAVGAKDEAVTVRDQVVANATPDWVYGTDYAKNIDVISPINGLKYRSKISMLNSTVDPSLSADWKLIDNNLFFGDFPDEATLLLADTTGVGAGWRATVSGGIGVQATEYIWDVQNQKWVQVGIEVTATPTWLIEPVDGAEQSNQGYQINFSYPVGTTIEVNHTLDGNPVNPIVDVSTITTDGKFGVQLLSVNASNGSHGFSIVATEPNKLASLALTKTITVFDKPDVAPNTTLVDFSGVNMSATNLPNNRGVAFTSNILNVDTTALAGFTADGVLPKQKFTTTTDIRGHEKLRVKFGNEFSDVGVSSIVDNAGIYTVTLAQALAYDLIGGEKYNNLTLTDLTASAGTETTFVTATPVALDEYITVVDDLGNIYNKVVTAVSGTYTVTVASVGVGRTIASAFSRADAMEITTTATGGVAGAYTFDTLYEVYKGQSIETLGAGGYGNTEAISGVSSAINSDTSADTIVGILPATTLHWQLNDTGTSGTWTGTETYAVGQFGNGASLDGASYVISAVTPTASADFTLSSWFKLTTVTGTQRIMGFNDGSDIANGGLYVNATGAELTIGGVCAHTDTGIFTLVAGTMYHMVTTYTAGENVRIYINDVLVFTIASTTFTTTSTVRVGLGGNYTLSGMMAGIADQLRFYQGVVATQAQVTSLFTETGITYTATIANNPANGVRLVDEIAMTSEIALGANYAKYTNSVRLLADNIFSSATNVNTLVLTKEVFIGDTLSVWNTVTSVYDEVAASAVSINNLQNTTLLGGTDISITPLTSTKNATAGWANSSSYSEQFVGRGLIYWQVTVQQSTTAIGISTDKTEQTNYLGSTANGWAYHADGWAYTNGVGTNLAVTYIAGDVIGVLYDTATGNLSFYKGGVLVAGGNTYTLGANIDVYTASSISPAGGTCVYDFAVASKPVGATSAINPMLYSTYTVTVPTIDVSTTDVRIFKVPTVKTKFGVNAWIANSVDTITSADATAVTVTYAKVADDIVADIDGEQTIQALIENPGNVQAFNSALEAV